MLTRKVQYVIRVRLSFFFPPIWVSASSSYVTLPFLGDRGRCTARTLTGLSSPLRRVLVGTYKWLRCAQRGISPLPRDLGLC